MLKERLQWLTVFSYPKNKSEWLYGGYPNEALFILTGEKQESFCGENFSEIMDFLANLKKNKDRVIVCASTSPNFEDTKIDEMGIFYSHAYSISNINPENKTLSIINPHDSTSEGTISYDDFFKYFYKIDFVELKDYSNPGERK